MTNTEDKEIQEKWPVIKDKLKQEYPQLTDEELRYEIGKEAELLERLQIKTGKNWKKIRDVLSLLG
jgi:hypothetical protein